MTKISDRIVEGEPCQDPPSDTELDDLVAKWVSDNDIDADGYTDVPEFYD